MCRRSSLAKVCVVVLGACCSFAPTIGAQSTDTGANGLCETTAGGDDVQLVPVGQGCPGAVGIDVGADGRSQSPPMGDDVLLIALGQGAPNCLAIGVGPNGVRDTAPGGDDNPTPGGVFTGPNGVCQTVAAGDDVQLVALNAGAPFHASVSTGPNGISETATGGDDTLLIPAGQGEPNVAAIHCGPNGVGESAAAGDDNPRPCVMFIRGDCNSDGVVVIADAVTILGVLFGGAALPPCSDACDVNDDGFTNIGDAIFALTFLFTPCSPTPPEPFRSGCGLDNTADTLVCGPGFCP
ncbi:MAG: hypothetical protein AB7O52_06005 [Planctomycetota bacterium]